MKRLLTALVILLGLSLPVCSQTDNKDEQMINASLRFIMESANLTKKEYQKFAKIYIEHNEELAKLNRELKPESREYIKRWSEINKDYMDKLEKQSLNQSRKASSSE